MIKDKKMVHAVMVKWRCSARPYNLVEKMVR